MTDRKRMPVAEFRALGFLQEINRLVLHPCGLALEVVVDEGGTERFGGVWDSRDDPEGICYGPDYGCTPDVPAATGELVKTAARQQLLGYVVQPLREVEP